MMAIALHEERRGRGMRRTRFLDQVEAAGAGDLRAACTAVVLPAGARRAAADLPGARVVIVDEGVVLTRSFGGDGVRSMIVARCSAGAVMPRPRDTELLQALTPVFMTAVPPAVWRRLMTLPEVADHLVSGLEETLLRQREAALSLAAIRHTDRVRRQLLELAREHGRVCRDGVRIDLPLTHDLIADMVGCARETVTRAFDELQRDGFVVRREGSYRLLVSPMTLCA